MKKDSVVVWIMAMMFIVTGVSFSATSSQASDLNRDMQNYNFHRQSHDNVIGIRLYRVDGKNMYFMVDVSVDPSHRSGTDGVVRPGPLQGVFVSVLPYDINGNQLQYSFSTSPVAPSGISKNVITTTVLSSPFKYLEVTDLLVMVVEQGRYNGFKFCRLFNLSDIIKQMNRAPNVPQPSDPDYWRKLNPGKGGGGE
jgi:hypothetical protein